MPLTTGTRLGTYEILAPLGAGGMGEVYRARDTRLNRDVALKVLPASFAQDPDRLARFEREAHVLASLNHPNIAQVHTFEKSGSDPGLTPTAFLVMELVDGEDLSQLISRGPLSVPDALPIARQITDALDAAHALGIVHRDLKPANIKITRDGQVKVLDFGLAKAIAPEGAGSAANAMNSPTLTANATAMGTILGTAAYMSPEQARGRAVDKRTDVWAFGCVLYEMVTGRRAFPGEDVTETLAAVVKDSPEVNAAPTEVRRLLARCLDKDPKKRLRDVADAWDLLEQPIAVAGPATSQTRATRWPWIVAAAGLVATIGLAVHDFTESRALTTPMVRFQVHWPGDTSRGADLRGARFFELSPDARHIAMVSQGFLWVRSLDSVEAIRLDRTEGATYPFWSPDSSQLAFFSDGQLKKIDRTGGPVHVICDASDERGGAWSRNGTIVFSSQFGYTGLARVPEGGGTPVALTKLTTAGASDGHRYPQFLPDGEHFLYLHLTAAPDVAGVYVGALDGSPPARLLPGQASALYLASAGGAGHLVFRLKEKLMAQPFDAGRRALSGEAFPIADVVGQGENTGLGAFSVADGGTLAFGTGTVTNAQLFWVDRAGKRLGGAVSPAGDINTFSLSRDERRIALGISVGTTGTESQIWTQSLPGESPSKLTFDAAPGWESPIWSPIAPGIAYATLNLAGLGGYEIRRKALDNSGAQDTIVRSDTVLYLWDWSADGKYLVYSSSYSKLNDMWMVPLDGKRVPVALTKSPAEDEYGQISPGGQWLAYAANERGRWQVFVQPFPGGGTLRLVSKDGGTMPRWSRDGKELFYRGADGQLMVVPVTSGSGPASAFEHGSPRALFGPIATVGNLPRFTYQPSADAQRFLIAVPVPSATPPITVVLNWHAGTKK